MSVIQTTAELVYKYLPRRIDQAVIYDVTGLKVTLLILNIISRNYSFYNDWQNTLDALKQNNDLQCIVGADVPFGKAQQPGLSDYADGIDTMAFLLSV